MPSNKLPILFIPVLGMIAPITAHFDDTISADYPPIPFLLGLMSNFISSLTSNLMSIINLSRDYGLGHHLNKDRHLCFIPVKGLGDVSISQRLREDNLQDHGTRRTHRIHLGGQLGVSSPVSTNVRKGAPSGDFRLHFFYGRSR